MNAKGLFLKPTKKGWNEYKRINQKVIKISKSMDKFKTSDIPNQHQTRRQGANKQELMREGRKKKDRKKGRKETKDCETLLLLSCL